MKFRVTKRGETAITPRWLRFKYESGKSLGMLVLETGLPLTTIRYRILSAGGRMRSKGEGRRVAYAKIRQLKGSWNNQRKK